jgi:NitT/TauT family transport system ATP-binding protein
MKKGLVDVKVSGLWKRFGDKQVLAGFEALFPAGQTSVIMGPSGCGKTTLLQILMGFVHPERGHVTGLPAHKSAVFQEDRLCEGFSALANVRIVCRKMVSEVTMTDHLERVGLSGSLDQPVRELSGGMRRRVAIVRAMLAPADIVLLDEPFKGLDETTRDMVLAYVAAHTEGRTVIAVTHSPWEAAALGGRILQMKGETGAGRSPVL